MTLLHKQVIESAVTALSMGDAELTLDLGRNYLAHWFVGVQFYTSSAGTVLATPTSGTIVYDLKTEALPDVLQRLSDSVDLATANEEVSWGSPSRSVKATLADIAGGSATHFKIIAVAVRE